MSETKHLTLGGVKCETFNDEHYANVRSFFKIENDFAIDSFDFSQLKPGGGKGGDPMKRTDDGFYFIKQMSNGDHKVLVDPVFAKDLAERVTDPANPSIIGPIIAHVSNPDTKFTYIAMVNCLRHQGKYFKQYDLKGCADDKLILHDGQPVPAVHKRVWSCHIHMGCGGEARKTYKQGKIEALYNPHLPSTKEHKELLCAAIEKDCEWLKERNLMDYSLIVGVVDKAENEEYDVRDVRPDDPLYAGKPLVSVDPDGKTHVLYVGIIDFLQKWTAGKTAAKAIKSLEHNKATIKPAPYAARFVEHFEHVLLAVNGDIEAQKEKRDNRQLGHRCYPLVRR
mmetsp:Transcript_632/g.817  ORF Transcript_632/g.817 Transcript_632/m.817 type:complete len:338 (+) Transcript_632:173-1186(+)|eukprot:CAMPEP_0204823404 /NCGR_PEP_ID=MMETSP1346-20131115/1451_1 /ASSEMBLY_ACC=CAM_ASM_000771 /TAXON_ID=215587 /ORGANISM="Aplanochytrium stocchinoi, Strain GSBS06" /LENGTH=337 /DNA_ID=CAMNT_0051950019 /DNA_START=86 /DNA_END=1099 /DNA_ORIENTATION=-